MNLMDAMLGHRALTEMGFTPEVIRVALSEGEFRTESEVIDACCRVQDQLNQKGEAMRQLTSHKVNGLNEKLKVEVLGEPGEGGACHSYSITPTVGNARGVRIDFQNGAIGPDDPPNGLSNEALLAIVEDRLLGFQSGPFACRENAIALTKIQEAMLWLQKRTRDRVARGVEGTHEK
jgi:hypothetical protein